MERLTQKVEGCHYCMAIPEDTTLSDLELKWAIYDKLGKFEDAEEKGRLLVLPFSVGDRIYTILDGFVEEIEIEEIFLGNYIKNGEKSNLQAYFVYVRDDCPFTRGDFMLSDIGKSIFLTEAEAEKVIQSK